MKLKFTPPQWVAIALLAVFTVFITWKAKELEKDFSGRSEASELVNKPAAAFELTALDGRSVSLADFRGKQFVVINFWASWCGPCHVELAELREFYKKRHTDSSNFEILAISVDDDLKSAESYATREKLPFPVLWDQNGKAASSYAVEAIPSLFLVDKSGTIILGQTGMNPALEVTLAVELRLEPTIQRPGAGDDDAGH